jgi:hypothetical protein
MPEFVVSFPRARCCCHLVVVVAAVVVIAAVIIVVIVKSLSQHHCTDISSYATAVIIGRHCPLSTPTPYCLTSQPPALFGC